MTNDLLSSKLPGDRLALMGDEQAVGLGEVVVGGKLLLGR